MEPTDLDAHWQNFKIAAQLGAPAQVPVALMGNVAPLDLGVRGNPEQVYNAALDCLEKAAPGGGMILSFGSGVSPGTRPENIDALLLAAQDWNKSPLLMGRKKQEIP